MVGLIINNEYLHRHPLWQHCAASLSDISKRDYHGKDYFPSMNIDVLDIDSYEKAIHKGKSGNMACTGDAVIGIALVKKGNTLMHPAVMIVELRMGYKEGDNISLSELENKVTHTKTLLSTALQVYPKYYFIFTDKEEPQARSLMYREAQEIGRMQEYKVTSVSDFNSNMKDPSQIPYQYQYRGKDITQSFNRCITAPTCDVNCYSKQFYHWLGIIEEMKKHYNQIEAEHIAECLSNELGRLKQLYLSEEETIEIEILTEELNNKGLI